MVNEFINKINALGISKEPFLFVIDFDLNEFIVEKLIECEVLFKIDNFTNFPISFEKYKAAFDRVKEEIKGGNTYLLNLASQMQLNNNLDLEEIFYASDAKFKIYVKDRFVCFSPERFIQIKNNKIQTQLPAGSITGTPKRMTTKIIREDFIQEFLVFFDEENLNSSVMIRFIEKIQNGYVYKSGEGISLLSDVNKEYEEMCEKIYVPLH